MTLQKLAVPLCLISGTIRYLPYHDFPAQVNSGLLIEFITITVPFLAVIVLYSLRNDGVFFFTLIGILTHLAMFILSIKHVHTNDFEPNRPCIFLD